MKKIEKIFKNFNLLSEIKRTNWLNNITDESKKDFRTGSERTCWAWRKTKIMNWTGYDLFVRIKTALLTFLNDWNFHPSWLSILKPVKQMSHDNLKRTELPNANEVKIVIPKFAMGLAVYLLTNNYSSLPLKYASWTCAVCAYLAGRCVL